ncbi:hypothetical protein ADK67_40140 [Saccharothrix sp. NRRL B-16348]|uniref:asparagine synthase-related protein n=1 Tax=Saccharothrix sp. NRRL B-16348 TaxID=1415542 RepID=UPI0006B00663|nr:asparagine synthase-related protein [Saccharothrix sp. NRRL B-16348]KOX16372.1 hypothetical protein ADK67_40140 [Saccharothrix sp. NRRL B-16348]
MEQRRFDVLGRWSGSYSTVVLHDHGVTVAVDLAGQIPFYHFSAPGRVVVGSTLSLTTAAAGFRGEPDFLAVAARVFCPDVPALVGDRSVVKGVRRLGGGLLLTAAADARPQVRSGEALLPDPGVTAEDAAMVLRSALTAAVAARVADGRSVSADFSGGADSTSIAFLAARQLSGPLRVFNYHNPLAPAHDLEYAERYARLDSRLRLEVVLGRSDTLTYRGLADVVAGDLPDQAAVADARTELRLSRIAAAGGLLHLGGEGADALLVPAPSYLADLARRGAVRGLAAQVLAASRDRYVSPSVVLKQLIRTAGTSMPRAFRGLAAQLERPAPQAMQWLDAISWWTGPGAASPWLTERARRELSDVAYDLSRQRDLQPRGVGIADAAALHDLRAAGAVHRRLVETARRHGIWPQAPFLDNDVIRACTKVGAALKVPDERPKPLLRKAMEGLVPAPVFARRTKGNYIGEDYLGVRAAVRSLTAFLSTSHVADLGLVDPEAVIRSVEQAGTGAPAPLPALNRLLGVEVWLRGLADAGPGR